MKEFIQEYLKMFLGNFFFITTGILFSTTVFTVTFSGIDTVISVRLLVEMLFAGFASTIPNLILINAHDLSKKKMLFRYVLHFIVLVTELLLLASYFDWIPFNDWRSICAFLLLFVLVYGFVMLMTVYRDYRAAKKLTASLKKFQTQHKIDE